MPGRTRGHFNPPPNWPPLPQDFNPPLGWQPDPRWGEPPDGWQLWIDDPPAAGTIAATTWPIAIALVLGVVGLIVGYQPVTLLSGSGILYVGLALTAGGAVLALVMKLPKWVRMLTIIAVVLVVANVAVVEHSLTQKRQQIQNELSNLSGR